MSKNFCPKSVPGLTNAKKYQTGKPTSNIYTSAWDWSDTIFSIKSKWSIGFECSHPIIFFPFRILTGIFPSIFLQPVNSSKNSVLKLVMKLNSFACFFYIFFCF